MVRLVKLRTSKLTVRFGGLLALRDIDLEVEPGEILGLIGPNGAGKTTLLNAATGFQHPSSGVILLGETDISSWRPARPAPMTVSPPMIVVLA